MDRFQVAREEKGERYKIDFDKVETVDDIKKILKSMQINYNITESNQDRFKEIFPYLKKVEEDV